MGGDRYKIIKFIKYGLLEGINVIGEEWGGLGMGEGGS